MIKDSGGAASRREGKSLAVAGVVVGGLALLTVAWAAEPVISKIVNAIGDQFGTPQWDVPGWAAKLILAFVLFVIAGLMLLIGGWRWGAGALQARRQDSRTEQLGLGEPRAGQTSELYGRQDL